MPDAFSGAVDYKALKLWHTALHKSLLAEGIIPGLTKWIKLWYRKGRFAYL